MRIVDLSQTLGPLSPPFPGDDVPRWVQNRFLQRDGYNTVCLHSCFHVATHVDAPSHLCDGGQGIADYSPERFAGRGIVFDVRGQSVIDAQSVSLAHVREGDAVLFCTGFDRYVQDYQKYFFEHPVIDNSLTEELVRRRVALIGLDMPSPDHEPYNVHRYILQNGMFIVENLSNLSNLLEIEEFLFLALPIKTEAEAAFARAVALVDYK